MRQRKLGHNDSVRKGIERAFSSICRHETLSAFVRNIVNWRMRIIVGLDMFGDAIETTFNATDKNVMFDTTLFAWSGYVHTSEGVLVYTIDNDNQATATFCKYIGGIYNASDKPTDMIKNISEGFALQDLRYLFASKCSDHVHDLVSHLTGDSRPDGNSDKGFIRNNDKYFVIIDGVHDQIFQDWMATMSKTSKLRRRYDATILKNKYQRVFFLEIDEAIKYLKVLRYAMRKYGIIYGDMYNPMTHYVGARKLLTNRLAANAIARRSVFKDPVEPVHITLDKLLSDSDCIIAVKPEYGNRQELDIYMMRKKYWLTKYPNDIRVVTVPFHVKDSEESVINIDLILATV